MASNDDVDDLFDYDAGLDDILREVEQKTRKTADSASNNPTKPDGDILGIDDEIKVTKKRAPIVKLDETRLLSQAGIPKLRKTAKTKLKLKGKGHEFSDAARLLNFYQLWLDDLYPRAKFSDGLSIIEKLGHTKRLQVMRKEWIDEGKSRTRGIDNEADDNTMKHNLPSREKGERQQGQLEPGGKEGSLFTSSTQPKPDVVKSIFGGDGDGRRDFNSTAGDDELFVSGDEIMTDLLPREGVNNEKDSGGDNAPGEDDDLDMLLAGGDSNAGPNIIPRSSTVGATSKSVEDDYENDWEAMQDDM
ncbi:chromosome segregation in meiosis protein 3 [Arthroderma uncinatum]|uniref:chromosome segregation in meiosis protein 3 n=1 Tax=Arthroderma uncinatum TaxID=74035 RepID=UPI00144A6767|nr:chromosome segregation in meiosis protein 3 [Arthroderma uncinatum]KAF3481013.1 chromosome segregation in meiosis protein 3 [Arthroderma uncinatum]